jgi:L-fuconolactonase
MVFVQAGCRADQAIDEVRWVLGLQDAWPELAAIVADADLRSGTALEHHLDTLTALAGPPGADGADTSHAADPATRSRVRVAGIRHLLQDEPDELLRDPSARAALVEGLRRLARRGFTFDVCVRHRQLETVIEVLELVPELPTVLDHVGKPPVDDGIDSGDGRRWADAIDRLATLPRAHVKLSGLAAEASDRAALDAHAGEFLAHALRAFGAQRAMIGSDWPVSALTGATGNFASWCTRVRRAVHAAGLGEEGAASVEGGTATRFYRLV